MSLEGQYTNKSELWLPEQEKRRREEKELFNGPDIILVCGPSQAGKSTFIKNFFNPNFLTDVDIKNDFEVLLTQHERSHHLGLIDHYHSNISGNKELAEQGIPHFHPPEQLLNFLEKSIGQYAKGSESSAAKRKIYEEELDRLKIKNRIVPLTFFKAKSVDDIYSIFFSQLAELPYSGHLHVIEWAGGENILKYIQPGHLAENVDCSFTHMLPFILQYGNRILPRIKAFIHLKTTYDVRLTNFSKNTEARGQTLSSIFAIDDILQFLDKIPSEYKKNFFDIYNYGSPKDFENRNLRELITYLCLLFIDQQHADLRYSGDLIKELSQRSGETPEEVMVRSDEGAHWWFNQYIYSLGERK